MSLQYDDIPGSWGTYSRDWPYLQFATKEETDRAFIACTKGNIVPYGSYVVVGNVLRVEDIQLRDKLNNFLNETPYKTYDQLKNHYVNKGLWT